MNNIIGTVYIVATPIGNLEDMTYRAVRILSEVDVILCEDTRHSSHLLKHYNIHTRTESYHAQSNAGKLEKIAEMLRDGKNIALISDAGTPLISDPGSTLIGFLKKTFSNDLTLVPIPGASALTTALSVIPVPSGHFSFVGFLPQKKGRQTALKEIAEREIATVLYESSHRIVKLLEELVTFCPDMYIYVARELTKQFEEIIEGSPQEVLSTISSHANKQKGEFVVVITKMLQ